MAAIAATLARYSEQIITDVTHPVTGLPTRLSWLPTVKEVFDACEVEAVKVAHQVAREKRIDEQLAARAEEDRAAGSRPTKEYLKEKYGDNWGLTAPMPAASKSKPAPTWGEIVKIYAADPSRMARLVKRDSDVAELSDHIDSGFGPSSI